MAIRFTCPTCGKRFRADERFAGRTAACPACKYSVEVPEEEEEVIVESDGETPATKRCISCGLMIHAMSETCVRCKASQVPQEFAHARRVTAALFALFLGGFGIHKFYLGKPVQGLLYLVFCWTFIPAVIGFVEGLDFLLLSDDKFAKRYMRK